MADDLIEIGIKVNSNAEAAYRGLDKLNGSVVNSLKHAERLQKNYALLDKAFNENKVTLQQYAKGIQQVDASIAMLNRRMSDGVDAISEYSGHVNQARGYTNRLGVVTQQAGYQVGDFFVQIQSGTNVFVALGQQATQLVGTFAMLSQSTKAIAIFSGLGIAIPIITSILAFMSRTTEETNKTVDAFKELTEATKELHTERMKLIDPNFSEMLNSSQSELSKLTIAYEDAKEAARLLSLEQSYIGTDLTPSIVAAGEIVTLEQQAADAAVERARAKLDAYQNELKLTEIERARVALQQEIGRLRSEEAQAYAETVAEANRLKDSIGQAYLEALGLAQVPMEVGIDKAAEAARLLAERLGISLTQAQNLINIASTKIPNDFRAPASGDTTAKTTVIRPPIASSNSGVGGGGTASDLLADLIKRVELEKELLGTSEEYQEVMRTIQSSDKKYSEAAIQGAVARLEAINKEKAALKQMESLQKNIAETIGDGFMSMVDGTKTVKDAFRDMARDIIKQLYEVLVIQRLVGSAQNGTGIAGLIGGMFANGGAFSAGRQIQAYANGGIVGGPTYFPMAGGKTGLMGESGPEAIMPLKRGKGGKLGVAVEGNSGSVVVNNTINVTGGSDPAAIRAEVAKLMPQITSATKSAVIDARRRGGQMKAAFQ